MVSWRLIVLPRPHHSRRFRQFPDLQPSRWPVYYSQAHQKRCTRSTGGCVGIV